ncbi:Hypothetical predicted protein [Paramuricea clavata]|uniref:Uncharacterized protein n=1 Tax=Paramuricea clavata TaxID=317549 RepID=A0A7D9LNW6_PARCT|nr:Hypothetical predicted protein [Paramuricea clavata]
MLVETPNRDNSQLLASLVDTVAILAHTQTNLSLVRKEQIKPALKKEYSAICSLEDQPNSKLLFGNDLAKNLKDAKEASSLSSSMKSYPPKQYNYSANKKPALKNKQDFWQGQRKNNQKKKPWRGDERRSDRTSQTNPKLGVVIECTETPVQLNLPGQKFHPHEYQILDAEISKLVGKGVVNKVQPETTQFISSIFLRPKPDGSHRLILNLKKFNETVVYHHFKMDSIYDITKLASYKGLLYGIFGFKGCILLNTHQSIRPKIFTFHLERRNLPVYMFAQWAFMCT